MRLTAGIAALFSILISLVGARELYVEHRMRSAYTPVDCTILSRTVVEEEPTTTEDDSGRTETHYPVRVTIRFEYRVDGVSYIGEDGRYFEKGAPEIAARYDAFPLESRRQCWFDPARPSFRPLASNDVSSLGTSVLLLVGLAGSAMFGFTYWILAPARRASPTEVAGRSSRRRTKHADH